MRRPAGYLVGLAGLALLIGVILARHHGGTSEPHPSGATTTIPEKEYAHAPGFDAQSLAGRSGDQATLAAAAVPIGRLAPQAGNVLLRAEDACQRGDTASLEALLVQLRSMAKSDKEVLSLLLERIEDQSCSDETRVILLRVVARLGGSDVGGRIVRFLAPSAYPLSVRSAALAALTEPRDFQESGTGRPDPLGDGQRLGIGQLHYRSPEIATALADFLAIETSEELQSRLLNALSLTPEVAGGLAGKISNLLSSTNPEVRQSAVGFLLNVNPSQYAKAVARMALTDSSESIRIYALYTLKDHAPDTFLDTLAQSVVSEKSDKVAKMISILMADVVRDAESSESSDKDESTPDYSVRAQELRSALNQMALSHENPSRRAAALWALRKIARDDEVQRMIGSMQQDPDPSVRGTAASALGYIRERSAMNDANKAFLTSAIRTQLQVEQSDDVKKILLGLRD